MTMTMTMTINPRRGFTLVNVMVSVAVLAVVAGAMVASLTPDDRARALGAAQLVASDLEYAQSLSLSEPHDPAVVVFDAVNEGYWIARASAPDEPIERSDGSPYVVIFGQGDAEPFAGVDLRVASGTDEGMLTFDSFGRLEDLADAGLLVGISEDYAMVSVSSSTGFTTVANTDPPTEPEAPPEAPRERGGGK